jgi:hypothetical protein
MRAQDASLRTESSTEAIGERRSRRLRTTALLSMLVISVALNVVLAGKVRQFNKVQTPLWPNA